MNSIIPDSYAVHTVNILRVAAGLREEALGVLTDLEGELLAKVGNATSINQKARLQALLEQTQGTISKAYTVMEKNHLDGLEGLASLEGKHMATTLGKAVGADIFSVAFSAKQLEAVASAATVMGHSSGDWWKKQAADLHYSFTGQMQRGILSGEDTDSLVRRIRGTKAEGYADGIMNIPRRQAEALVRSSAISTTNQARLATMGEMDDVVKGIQWLSTLDGRTTPICISLSGKMWRLPDYLPVGHSHAWPGPTAHWNCFTGDVPVASPASISRLYRRPYSGELVTIETDNGRRITATPNHPILTRNGWRAIGTLAMGDDLVCQKGTGAAALASPHDQAPQTSFSELAEATAKLRGMLAVKMPVSTPDFHGDGTDKEIGEVWSYGGLSDEGHARIAKCLPGFQFQRTNLEGADFLPGDSAAFQTGLTPDTAADGGMSSGHGGPLPACPSGMQISGPGAGDTSGSTPTIQSSQADVELPDDFAGRDLIGDVESDRVCFVSRREAVSVLVHNVETDTGWYLASGIISHNCRSTQIPVLRSWEELSGKKLPSLDKASIEERMKQKLGAMGMDPAQIAKAKAHAKASMDGQVSKDLNFEDWLHTKPDTFIDKVLGPGRAKLWNRGKGGLSLSDLTNQDNRPLTIAQLKDLIENGSPLPETQGVTFFPGKKFPAGPSAAELSAQKAAAEAAKAAVKKAAEEAAAAAEAAAKAAAKAAEEAAAAAKAAADAAAHATLTGKAGVLEKAIVNQLAKEGPLDAAALVKYETLLAEKKAAAAATKAVNAGKKATLAGDSLPPSTLKYLNDIDPDAKKGLLEEWAAAKATQDAAVESIIATLADSQPLAPAMAKLHDGLTATQKLAVKVKVAEKQKAIWDGLANILLDDAAITAAAENGAFVPHYMQTAKAGLPPGHPALDEFQKKMDAALKLADQKNTLKIGTSSPLAHHVYNTGQMPAHIKAALDAVPDTAPEKVGFLAAAAKSKDAAMMKIAEDMAAGNTLTAAQADLVAALTSAELKQVNDTSVLLQTAAKAAAGPFPPPAAPATPPVPTGPTAPGITLTTTSKGKVALKMDTISVKDIKAELQAHWTATATAAKPYIWISPDSQGTIKSILSVYGKKELKSAGGFKVDAKMMNYLNLDPSFSGPPPPVVPAAPKVPRAKLKPVALTTKQFVMVPDDFPKDPAKLKVVKKLGGSTGAELVADTDGTLYVRKRGASADHARAEFQADRFYEALGVAVPRGALYDAAGSSPVKLTRFSEGKEFSALTGAEKAEAIRQLQKGFAIDALLGNWDVVGSSGDNVLFSGGRAMRIDNGGAFHFRAQGAVKSADEWNEHMTDLYTMRRGPRIVSYTKEAFGSMDFYDIADQIAAIPEEAIDLLDLPADVKHTLRARLHQMQAISERADRFRADAFHASYFDVHAEQMINIRKSGIDRELMTDTTRSGVTVTDKASGRAFGNLRTSGAAVKSASPGAGYTPPEPIETAYEAMKNGFITHNHKVVNGGVPNVSTLQAAVNQKAVLADIVKTGSASEAAAAKAYLAEMPKLEKALADATAGKTPTAPLPHFQKVASTPAKSPPPPQTSAHPPGVSVVTKLHNQLVTELVAEGRSLADAKGAVDIFLTWTRKQGWNSWNDEPMGAKYWIWKQRNVPQAANYWDGNGRGASFQSAKSEYEKMAKAVGGEETLDRIFAGHHALMQEQLALVDVDYNDRDAKALLLLRTEAQRIHTAKPGQTGTILRGGTESHSIFNPVYVMASSSDPILVQAVPHSRVLWSYWFEGEAGNPYRNSFLGDGENEFAADSSLVPFKMFPGGYKHPVPPSRSVADWAAAGVPVSHLP